MSNKRRARPKDDCQYAGKGRKEVEHSRAKSRRAVINPSIPNKLRNESAKCEYQSNPLNIIHLPQGNKLKASIVQTKPSQNANFNLSYYIGFF